MLLSGKTAPVRRISVPREWIGISVLVALAILVSFIWMAGSLITFRYDMQRIESMKRDNQAKTLQLEELRQRLHRLENEKENIAKKQEEIKRLMGISPTTASGHETPSRSGASIEREHKPAASVSEEDRLQGVSLFFNDIITELVELERQIRSNPEYYQARPNTWPTAGRISSPYGVRKSPFSRRSEMHTGVDIAADVGTPVRAAASGTVVFAGFNPIYGRLIKIDHGNGYVTWYGHNRANLVEVGDEVKKGQIIARVGSSGRSSGPHLHFAIQGEGGFVDPELYLPRTER